MAYYTPSGAPASQGRGASVSIRNEFILVQQGFNLLGNPVSIAASLLNYAIDVGAVNAIVCTVNSNVVAYTDGLELVVKMLAANTSAVTINAGALGIKNVVRTDGTPLQLGDLSTNQIVTLRYDSIAGNFQATFSSVIAANSASTSATAAAASAAAASASAAAAAATALPATKILAVIALYTSQNFGVY